MCCFVLRCLLICYSVYVTNGLLSVVRFCVCGVLLVGCWLIVVGCWLLVVGCWLLVVGSRLLLVV